MLVFFNDFVKEVRFLLICWVFEVEEVGVWGDGEPVEVPFYPKHLEECLMVCEEGVVHGIVVFEGDTNMDSSTDIFRVAVHEFFHGDEGTCGGNGEGDVLFAWFE